MITQSWTNEYRFNLEETLNLLIEKGSEIICVVPTEYYPWNGQLKSALIVYK